jgi:hypothetical protein
MHAWVRSGVAAVATWVAFVVAGCGSDPRPKYVAPRLPDSELATITGVKTLFKHYYIGEVDGAKVQDQEAPFYTAGSSVKVLQGERRLMVFANAGAGQAQWTFVHPFEAGHAYTVGPAPAGGPLCVKDKGTGQVRVID